MRVRPFPYHPAVPVLEVVGSLCGCPCAEKSCISGETEKKSVLIYPLFYVDAASSLPRPG